MMKKNTSKIRRLSIMKKGLTNITVLTLRRK